MKTYEKYLNEAEIIDINKKLRGDATDSFIKKVILRTENDLGWALYFYEKDNNRKELKKRIKEQIKHLSYLNKKLK